MSLRSAGLEPPRNVYLVHECISTVNESKFEVLLFT